MNKLSFCSEFGLELKEHRTIFQEDTFNCKMLITIESF